MSLDSSLVLTLNSLAGHSSVVDALIVFCASYLAYILAVLFVGWVALSGYEHRKKLEILFVAGLSTLLARGVVTELIRYFYHRPRPFSVLPVHNLLTDPAWSFPSGHATFFFALSTAVYLYNKRWGRGFLVVSTVLVLARVVAGVHYPSDVVAGALIGSAISYSIYAIFKHFREPKSDKTY